MWHVLIYELLLQATLSCYAYNSSSEYITHNYPDSKVHWASMGPTWVLPASDGPHVGPMNLAIGVSQYYVDIYNIYFNYANDCQFSMYSMMIQNLGALLTPLAPGSCGNNFQSVTHATDKVNEHFRYFWNYSYTRWISCNAFDVKWTLVQIMAWCHQAISPHLIKYMAPYGTTRSQKGDETPLYLSFTITRKITLINCKATMTNLITLIRRITHRNSV